MGFRRALIQGFIKSSGHFQVAGTVSGIITIVIIISSLQIRKTKNAKTVSELYKVKWQINDRSKIQAYSLRLQTNVAIGAKAFYRVLWGIVLWSLSNLGKNLLNLPLHSINID